MASKETMSSSLLDEPLLQKIHDDSCFTPENYDAKKPDTRPELTASIIRPETNETSQSREEPSTTIKWKLLILYQTLLLVLSFISFVFSITVVFGCKYVNVTWLPGHILFSLNDFGIFYYRLDNEKKCQPYSLHSRLNDETEDVVGTFLRENLFERYAALVAIFLSFVTFLINLIAIVSISAFASTLRSSSLKKLTLFCFRRISLYSKFIGSVCHLLTLSMLRSPNRDKNNEGPIVCDGIHSKCSLGINGVTTIVIGFLYFIGFLFELYIEKSKGYFQTFSNYEEPPIITNSVSGERDI